MVKNIDMVEEKVMVTMNRVLHLHLVMCSWLENLMESIGLVMNMRRD